MMLDASESARKIELHPILLHVVSSIRGGLKSATLTFPSNAVLIGDNNTVAYDRDFQARLADEVARLPPGAVLEQAILDYARLRDQARDCAIRPTAP